MLRLVLLKKSVPIVTAFLAWLVLPGIAPGAEPAPGKQLPAKKAHAGAETQKQGEPKTALEPEKSKAPPPRDPFAVDASLLGGGGQLQALPKLELRGWLESAQGKRIALLEVEKGTTYLVHEGDQLVLHHQGRSWQLVVQRIEPAAVVLRLGGKGPEFTVR